MKGILFNLLEDMGQAAGCSDEAWELVVEFAAAEALLDHASSPQLNSLCAGRLSYQAPTEAMIRCLSQQPPTRSVAHAWEPHEPGMCSLATGPEFPATRYGSTEHSAPPAAYGAGFTAEAFLKPRVLLDAWGHDVDLDEADAMDDWMDIRLQKTEPQKD